MRTGRGIAVAAGLLLLAALGAAAAGCGRLTDVAWMRIREIDSVSTSKPVTSIDVTILTTTTSGTTTTEEPGPSDTVNIVIGNQSSIIGSTGGQGVGITLTKAHVSYSAPGMVLPSYDYPATLFIPASSSTGTGTGATTTAGEATLAGFPIVPHDLKVWLVDNVRSSVRNDGFHASATITLEGHTDQGLQAVATGGLTIVFADGGTGGSGGGGGGGGATLPTVSISATTATADQSAATAGVFTITRSGDTTSALNITHATSGDALATNYTLSPSSFFIAAGDTSTTISVHPTSSPVLSTSVELTITLTASGSSNYTVVGSPDTVTIQP